MFFVFQVAMAYVFAIPQLFRLFEDVRGVTINWLLLADLFVVFNLILTFGTHRKVRSRDTLQTLIIYANWVILVTPMVVVTFFRCNWTGKDTLVATLVATSATLVVAWACSTGRSLREDPLVKGLLVGLFRVVPHLYLVYCIVRDQSGSGLAAKAVIAANITATARIITLISSGRKSGWEKRLVSSLISEIANEGSWLLVTVFWFFYR